MPNINNLACAGLQCRALTDKQDGLRWWGWGVKMVVKVVVMVVVAIRMVEVVVVKMVVVEVMKIMVVMM